MIVITSLNRTPKYVCPGDTFHLTITDETGRQDLVVEEITENRVIDFIASFRFAREDGTVLGFHLSGFFGDSRNLPDEMKSAIHFDELSDSQKKNFINSVGIRLK